MKKNAVSENLGSFGSFGEKNIALALIRIRAGIGQCLSSILGTELTFFGGGISLCC